MKTKLIRIGNSRGIRIPKALLDQCDFKETVELETHNGCLTIRSVDAPREDWDEAFRQMAEAGDDVLLDQNIQLSTAWDETEWEW
jgi:antitoxin MazE